MRYGALLILFLSLTLGVGCTQSGKKGAFTGQIISITDSLLTGNGADTIRFGRLSEGEIARKRLSIKNNTTSPQLLLSHKTTCGCVRLDYERKPFAVGETLPLDMEFDLRGEWGWQMKLITLYFGTDSSPYKLYVEAEVE